MPAKTAKKARSKAQANLFKLVKAVQDGDKDPKDVTQNVRKMAADTSEKDAEKLTKPKKGAPERVKPKKGKESSKEDTKKRANEVFTPLSQGMREGGKYSWDKVTSDIDNPGDVEDLYQISKYDYDPHAEDRIADKADEAGRGDGRPPQDPRDPPREPEGLSFFEIVGRYNEYGEVLKRSHTLGELAAQLADIAEYSQTALQDESADWYEAHTVGRHLKEMQAYAKEFQKVAEEADSHHMRLEALYNDMGSVLERYFEIYDKQKNEQDTDEANVSTGTGTATGVDHHYDPDSGIQTDVDPISSSADATAARVAAAETRRKLQGRYQDHAPLRERAINIARSLLKEADLPKFEALTPERRAAAAWRIISKSGNR